MAKQAGNRQSQQDSGLPETDVGKSDGPVAGRQRDAAAAESRQATTGPGPGPRTLNLAEIETLRQRLQKKFH